MSTAKDLREGMRRLRHVVRGLEQQLMPVACAFCGRELAADAAPVCPECRAELPWIDPACRQCGMPLPAKRPGGVSCGRCQRRPPPFTTVVAPLRYEFPVDAAIKALKFRRKLHYVPAFTAILGEAARRLPPGIDGLLPVPLHWRRQLRRGFNQAAELCRALEADLRLPVLQQVRRTRSTPYQSGLGAEARRANLRGAFRLCKDTALQHVLIVDDVVTTGATCSQLAALLKAAGVAEISVLAIARATSSD
jgi:ComF family protein